MKMTTMMFDDNGMNDHDQYRHIRERWLYL